MEIIVNPIFLNQWVILDQNIKLITHINKTQKLNFSKSEMKPETDM